MALGKEEQHKKFIELKAIRSVAKNANYASQYLAGPKRISLTAGISLDDAKNLYKAYWNKNWAWREVSKQIKVKEVDGEKWLWNPVSNFWYSLRHEKDIGNTLVQGTASYVFDLWLSYVLRERPQLTATFHDEGVWVGKTEEEKEITRILLEAEDKVNAKLKLNRELSIGVQVGKRYSEIH